MKPYETIYLQWGNHADWDSITWCADEIDDDDVEYIRKDIYDELKAENEVARVAQLRAELVAIKPDWKDNELREALADASHEIWSSWMQHLFSVCETSLNGNAMIPDDKCTRWFRQIGTDYSDLSEHEKDSDREQADKILAVLRDTLERRPEES